MSASNYQVLNEDANNQSQVGDRPSQAQNIEPGSGNQLPGSGNQVPPPSASVGAPQEIELQNLNQAQDSNDQLNPRAYLPDPRIPLKKKVMSLQQQKALTEEKNKKEIEIAIFKRIVFRIFIFFVYLAFMVLGFIGIYLYLAYIRSSEEIEIDGRNLVLKVSNCKVIVYDDPELNNKIRLNFEIPGTFDFWLDEYSSLDSSAYVHNNSNITTLVYKIKNILSMESCTIGVYLGQGDLALNNFDLFCNSGTKCAFVSYSQNFRVKNETKISGNTVEMNLRNLNTNSFYFQSVYGSAQINNFQIKAQSIVNLTHGNIILQSTSDYGVNWTSSVPSYCMSAPSATHPTVTGCHRVKTNIYGELVTPNKTSNSTITAENSNKTVNVSPNKTKSSKMKFFHSKSEEKTEANSTKNSTKKTNKTKASTALPPSCWGKVYLCSDDNECTNTSKPLVIVGTMTGGIYANVIKEEGKTVPEDNTIVKSLLFSDPGESIKLDWAVSSKKNLYTYLTESQDPKNFDPSFIIKFGSKDANSSTFQQWVITSNPAYSYLRPWWMGTYSLTLLTTATYELNTFLNPGFCPYTPNLSQEKLYAVQDLLTSTFINQTVRGITTYSHPAGVPLPPTEEDLNGTNYGFRTVGKQNEIWINIDKQNSTFYQYDIIDLNDSPVTKYAVYVSVILASLVGLYLVVGVVFGINVIYLDIIEIVTSTSKYSKINSKEDPGIYQPLMADEGKKGKKDDKSIEEVPSMSYNPVQMFRQLFVLAPPMSAFIDFLCVFMSKKYVNSAEVFYSQIFVSKKKTNDDGQGDEELHDLQKEQISGTEMKTFYEKFCYLNGYLERKLDDDSNLSILASYGFKLITKNDSLTQNYTKVIIKDEPIPKLGKDKDRDQDSMKLFIENCCKITKFETDAVAVDIFNSSYEEFCLMNHLKKESPSLSQMTENYKIGNKYLPQQWVVRKEEDSSKKKGAVAEEKTIFSSCTNKLNEWAAKIKLQPSLYYIDRKKINNHFSLLMQLPEKIETPEELTLANKELILFHGWIVVDTFTVLFHILTILILMTPVLVFFCLENVLYSQFSLVPDDQLITFEDITNNIWGLPWKLYQANLWIKILCLLVIIFWILGFLDLLYYYMKMEFPQDKFFRQTRAKEAAFIQVMFRRLMWVLVLISFYILGTYISLALVWMILGAIINPTAFLPYAAAASTFVTVCTTKYAEFMDIAENGMKKVIDYIKQITEKELNQMLKKMDIAGEMKKVVDSDTFKGVASQAAELGLVDQETLDSISKNAENMLKNPLEAAKTVGGEMEKIMSDPQAFINNMAKMMEEKTLSMVGEKISKIFPRKENLTNPLIDVLIALLKSDNNKLKGGLHDLLTALRNELKDKMNIPESILNLMWSVAFISNPKMEKDDFLMEILDPLASFLVDTLTEQGIIDYYTMNIVTKDSVSKCISMIQSVSKGDLSSVTNNLMEMIDKIQHESFINLKSNKKMFEIAIALLDGNSLNYRKIFGLVKQFMKDMKISTDLVDFFELLLNSFFHQDVSPNVRDLNSSIEKILKYVNPIPKPDPNVDKNDKAQIEKRDKEFKTYKQGIKNASSYITMFFSFIFHEFENIPKEILRKMIDVIKDTDPSFKTNYLSDEKSFKNIIPVLQAAYETIGCFLTDPITEIKSIESNASSFGVKSEIANQIKIITTIKYEEMYPGKEVFALCSTQLWKDICDSLQVNNNIMMGIFGLITMRFDDISEINDAVALILKMGKVDASQKSKFLDLYKIYASSRESDLFTAANNLALPKEFVPLLLVGKRILDPKFVSDEEWIELGLSDDVLLNERYTIFNNPKAFAKWVDDVSLKIRMVNENLNEGNDDGLAKVALLKICSKGPVSVKILVEDLKSLSNVKNKLAQTNANQLELLKLLINIRCINIKCTSTFDSDTKTGIIELSKAINIEDTKLEQVFSLLFLTKGDKIIQSINYFSPDFIDSTQSEHYEKYITYVVDKMEKILHRESFIKNKFTKIFQLDIPPLILSKFICNPNEKLDLNSMYELISYPLKSTIIKDPKTGACNYRDYDECLHAVSPIMKYLSSHMDVQHTMLIRKIFNIEHEGIANLIKILNDNNPSSSINLFLDHVRKSTGEGLTTFISLMTIFQGRSTNVDITNTDQKKLSVKQFIQQNLGIYPELFDALYGIYMSDTHQYSENMLKYFRRVEACKLPPGSNISFQSLVKIPSSIVENVLNFSKGLSYNSQIISKEFTLSEIAIEFGSGLVKIMNAEPYDRQDVIGSVCSDNQFKMALAKISVKPSELLTILKLLYGCYDPTDIKWIFSSLKIDDKIRDETIFKNMLSIDQLLDVYGGPQANEQMLKKVMDGANGLVKDTLQLDSNLVSLASSLMHGDFTILLTMSKNISFLFPSPEQTDYTEFLMGICGIISHRQSQTKITTTLSKYYKNLLKRPPRVGDPDYMSPESTLSYATFCMFKNLDINPIWTFLFVGDLGMWDYIWDCFYYNRNYKDPFKNPILILIIVLNYIDTPTAFKEIMGDVAFIKNYVAAFKDPKFEKLYNNENFKKLSYPKFDPNVIEHSWSGYSDSCKELSNYVWANWGKTEEKLKDLAKKHHFPTSLIDRWPFPKDNFSDKAIEKALKDGAIATIKKENENNDDIEDFCRFALKSDKSLEEFLEGYKNSEIYGPICESLESVFPKMIFNVYLQVSNILEDPRDIIDEEEENKKDEKEKKFDYPNLDEYFEGKNAQDFTFLTLSSLVEIRNSYFNLHDYSDQGEDHYKLFTYKLDVMLSMIEKFNFHKNFTTYMSKFRVMQLFGLSAGFSIRGEDMIRANCTQQFNNYELQLEIAEKKKNKAPFYDFVIKMNRIYNILSNFRTTRDSNYLHIYNLGILETALENENYFNINIEPENVVYNGYPLTPSFVWYPYIYDVPTANELMDVLVYTYSDYYSFYDSKEKKLEVLANKLYSYKNNNIDLRTGKEWKEIVDQLDEWNSHFDNEQFLTLAKIFRGDYSAVLDSNSFFTINYGNDSYYLYGLLGLNSSCDSSNEDNINSCELYINSACQYIESNRKAITEIVKYIYGDTSTIQKFATDFGDNEETFSAFMKLSSNSVYPDMKSLRFLINKLNNLSTIEFKTLSKIIEVYFGMTNYLEELVLPEFTQNKILKIESSQAFCSFIGSLDYHTIGSEVINPDYYDLTAKSNFSINPEENEFLSNLELFKVAMFQYPNSSKLFDCIRIIDIPGGDMFGEIDPDDATENQKENLKKKPTLRLFFKFISSILNNDFSMLFQIKEKEKDIFIKILKILNFIKPEENSNSEKDFNILKVISALKPSKLKVDKNGKNVDIDIQTRSSDFQKAQIVALPEFLENKVVLEKKISSLVLGMQHWNIVEILNGLDNEENKELYCLFQSFYIWKNLGDILLNWETVQDGNFGKVIGMSVKGFLGKILQIIKKLNDSKQNKKKRKATVVIPGAAGADKKVDDLPQDIADYDKNYLELINKMRTTNEFKLKHGYIQKLNYEVEKHRNKKGFRKPHYLEWMISLSQIFTKENMGNDPISKFEQFITGRYLKKYTSGAESTPLFKFLYNYTIESYLILHDRKSAVLALKSAEKKDEGGEKSMKTDMLAPIKGLPSFIVYFPNLDRGDETLKSMLKIFDLFMRLMINLQKKSDFKGLVSKVSDEMTLACLGVLKMVLNHMQFAEIDLVFDIISLLTGYDLSGESISNKKSKDLESKLFSVFSKTILSDSSIKKYINAKTLQTINAALNSLLNFNIKTLTDPKFMTDIIELLCAISGSKRKEPIQKIQPQLTKKDSLEKKDDKKEEELVPLEEETGPLLSLPIEEIEAVFQLIQGDWSSIEVLVKLVDSDSQKGKMVMKLINQIQSLGVFGGKSSSKMGAIGTGEKSGDNEIQDIMKKIQEGKATVHELFLAVDREGDSSGSISKQEFDSIAKKLNINLTQHRINEIFASIKKGSGGSLDEDLNEEEFGKAMQYLNNKNSSMALDTLGISKGILIMALIGLVIILLLLFVFIFLGIEAFAVGGAFGSVINSLMPMAAGAGVGGGKDEAKGKKISDENLGETVSKTKTIIQSNQL